MKQKKFLEIKDQESRMKIYSDKISEKYRKYVIKIKPEGSTSYFTLWGTDNTNEDFDYILLDQSNYILSFKKISDLLEYIKTSDKLIDKKNTRKWAKSYTRKRAYCSYDLNAINSLLSMDINALVQDKDSMFTIIDFINLFSDYAHQTEEGELIKMLAEKNTRVFKDYGYAAFFWQKSTNKMPKMLIIDDKGLKSNILKMILVFTRKIKLVRT